MKFKKLFLVILLFVILSSLSAVVSYQDAKNLVLNQIIPDDVGKVNIYAKSNPVSKTTGFDLHKSRNIVLTYNSSWVFFINDSPSAKWCHPVRYISIDTQNGNFEIINESIYPANSYNDFEMISSPSNPTTTSTQITLPTPTVNQRTENGKLHAVIIGGDKLNNPNQWDDDECFWNDVSGVYCTLLNYGYSRESIIVHYAEGEGPGNNQDLDDPTPPATDDIDFDADKNQIISTFNNLAATLTPEDMLFVYLNDHGYYNGDDVYLMLPGDDVDANRLYDHEIATLTRNINCAQMIFLIDCCYSGGFIDDLDDSTALCQNRAVHTLCDFEPGYGEKWITSPSWGLNPKYTEFTLYWTAAVREQYPYINAENTQEVIAWDVLCDTGTFPFTVYSNWNHPNPYYPNHDNYPDYHPDIDDGNNDGFVQMNEIFRYANNWDSFSNDTAQSYNGMPGYCNPFWDPMATRNFESPQQFPSNSNDFLNKFLTLGGLSGTLTISDFGSNITLTGNYLFAEEFRVKDGITLTISSGSQITITKNSNFILEDGAELIIENGADIILGDNILFSTPNGEPSGSVKIQGSSPINCYNLTFNNCKLYTTDTRMILNGGSFSDSYLKHLNETLIINDVDFDQTKIYAENRVIGNSSRLYVQIENCSIQNSTDDAVFISSYPSIKIKNNTISNNQGIGLNLYLCTNGYIENNYIVNNGAGIYLNNTEVEILNHNLIQSNDEHGIVALNYSNWSLIGQNDYPCQTIYDNYGNNAEIWFNITSQPDQVLYNKIYDSNYSSEFIYCSGVPLRNIDVTNNFWGNGNVGGNSRIPITANLTPFFSFDYDPVWHPGVPKGGEDLNAEIMYLEAKEMEANEEYISAEITYKNVITQYPSSEYSKMAAKQLLSLEELTDQDFVALKYYYDNEPNMSYDEEMIKVSSFLSNQCNIKNSDFPAAIDWYEEVIINPPTQVDSVMAVIDLGHTYLLMEENGNRGNYTGKLSYLKPDSWIDYEEDRTHLLNNLFGEISNEQNEDQPNESIPECVILNGNYPNPFNPSTIISFSIPTESEVDVSIYNIKGQKVKTVMFENLTKGEHQVEWDGFDDLEKAVSSGVYFYNLTVNGKSESVRKCLLLK